MLTVCRRAKSRMCHFSVFTDATASSTSLLLRETSLILIPASPMLTTALAMVPTVLTHSQRLKSWDSGCRCNRQHRLTFRTDRICHIVQVQLQYSGNFRPAGRTLSAIMHAQDLRLAPVHAWILYARIRSTVSLRFPAFSYFQSMYHAFPQSAGSWNCMF